MILGILKLSVNFLIFRNSLRCDQLSEEPWIDKVIELIGRNRLFGMTRAHRTARIYTGSSVVTVEYNEQQRKSGGEQRVRQS